MTGPFKMCVTPVLSLVWMNKKNDDFARLKMKSICTNIKHTPITYCTFYVFVNIDAFLFGLAAHSLP